MTQKTKNIVVIIFVVVAIAGFFFIAKNFGSGESAESEQPAVICKPQNALPEQQECFWTAHIHAHVTVFRDGKEVTIGFEKGALEGQHTHPDPNEIHWHGLIPADPNTKEVADWSVFEVRNIVIDLKLPQEFPIFIVNGVEVPSSHLWQDHDIIEIRYERQQ